MNILVLLALFAGLIIGGFIFVGIYDFFKNRKNKKINSNQPINNHYQGIPGYQGEYSNLTIETDNDIINDAIDLTIPLIIAEDLIMSNNIDDSPTYDNSNYDTNSSNDSSSPSFDNIPSYDSGSSSDSTSFDSGSSFDSSSSF